MAKIAQSLATNKKVLPSRKKNPIKVAGIDVMIGKKKKLPNRKSD
jgi:hypothetical protein